MAALPQRIEPEVHGTLGHAGLRELDFDPERSSLQVGNAAGVNGEPCMRA